MKTATQQRAELLAEQRADARQNGSYYWVALGDRDDPFGGWFDSGIEGTYDQCCSQVQAESLDMDFDVQIIEG
jgi:hypothetical protein|tara:strand:- start:319 stop:537 length:219 start_codon:yes stop_codon:yes gene_type:complete